MAEPVKHITELDFDISKISEQLKNINEQTSKQAVSVKNVWEGTLKDIGKSTTITVPRATFDSFEKAKDGLVDILKLQGEISKQKFTYNPKTGLLTGAELEIIDSKGRKLVETFNLQKQAVGKVADGVQKYKYVWEQTNAKITNDILQRNKLETSALVKQQQELSTRINGIDTLIQKQRELSKREEISKKPDLSVISKSNALIAELTTLRQQLETKKKITEQDKIQLGEIQQRIRDLKIETIRGAETVPKQSYWQQVIDKFRWTSAFMLTNAARRGVQETISTLKEVEFSVMEITRVLNDSSLDVEKYTRSIFERAINYGNSFENASEITKRFAQSGYNASDSLKMLETTMLALNTAELSTEEATTSLISIMQQWNLEAKDYQLLVDKINITSDNFALTSQDLVDALMKSSSVAKNAGIQFDELVSILTTMKVASGQAGTAVGNAFRSIIAYIQRAQSLKGFEAIGIKVFADEAQTKLLPMMEILENMSNKWNEMDEDSKTYFMNQNEGLTKALDQTGEYAESIERENRLKAEGVEVEKISQSTLASGNLRRNYYISLMENFSNVQKVSNNLLLAEGYSVRENAKYMETMTAKYNQFITILKSIAVAAGESGLTDLAKTMLDLANATLKFANQGEMTLPLLASIGVMAFKAYTNHKWYKDTLIEINKVTDTNTKITMANVAAQKLKNLSDEKAIALLGVKTFGLVAAVAVLAKWVQTLEKEYHYVNLANESYKNAVKNIETSNQSRREQIDLGEEYLRQLLQNVDENGKLNMENEEAIFYVNKLNKIMPELNLKYDEQANKINLTSAEIENYIEKLQQQYDLESKTEYLDELLKKRSQLKWQLFEIREEMKKLEAEGKKFTARGEISGAYGALVDQERTLDEQLKETETLRDKQVELLNKFISLAEDSSNKMSESTLNFVKKNKLAEESISSIIGSIKDLNSTLADLEKGESISVEKTIELINAYPELVDKLELTTDGYKIQEDAIKSIISAKKNKLMLDKEAQIIEIASVLGLSKLSKEMVLASNHTARLAIAEKILAEASKEGIKGTEDLKVAIKELSIYAGDFFEKLKGEEEKATSGGGTAKTWFDIQTESWERLYRMGQKTSKEMINFYRQIAYSGKISAEDRKKAEDKLFDIHKKNIEDTLKLQIDSLNKQKDAVSKLYDNRIDKLRNEEKEKDRIREKEEYYENRRKIKLDIESAKMRSGVEAKRAQKEGYEKLAELDEKYSEKQEKNDTEREIERQEKLKKLAVENIENQIDGINKAFDEQRQNELAYNATFNNEMYEVALSNYIYPVANGIVDGFVQASDIALTDIDEKSKLMYDTMQKNYVEPISQDLKDLYSLSLAQSTIPINPQTGSSITSNNKYNNIDSSNRSRAFTVNYTTNSSGDIEKRKLLRDIDIMATNSFFNLP
ncbi:MAG TPA: phage tail tape measure protein [Sedimentibacter sp.]|nr:phage tail tape measure protein [Sedimentibacter sp.]